MSIDRTTSALLWRTVPVLAVFVLTILAFEAGVDVSDRPGVPDMGIGTHIYYAIGLFLLGGMDLGTPVGGPGWARAMLWGAYFLGPTITTSAVAEGFLRLVHPRWLGTVRLRKHIVLVGAGPSGLLYLDAIHAQDPHRWVVVVDLDELGEGAAEVARRRNVSLVRGDIRRASVRALLRLDRAYGLVLTTGSDLTNLEVCWDVLADHPRLPVAVQVADIGLRRKVADLALAHQPHIFNAHEVAARHLYRAHLAHHFEHTGARDAVVLAGFGRFGQTILEYLHRHAQGEVARVIILDRDAKRRGEAFADQVGFDARMPHLLIDADLNEAGVWDRLAPELAGASEHAVVVLCTDDDAANLSAAIAVHGHLPGARAYVRLRKGSRFSAALGERLCFATLPVEELLAEALRAHYRDCFRPPEA